MIKRLIVALMFAGGLWTSCLAQSSSINLNVMVTSRDHDSAQVISQPSPDVYTFLIRNYGNFSVQIEATPGAGNFQYPIVNPGSEVIVRGVDLRAYLAPGAPEGASAEIRVFVVSKG